MGPVGPILAACGANLWPSWTDLGPLWGHRGPTYLPNRPKMAPKGAQLSPNGTQEDPKVAQLRPQNPPRGVPNRSQIGLRRLSNIEAEKGSALPNLKRPFWQILGPSWGPYGAYVGP